MGSKGCSFMLALFTCEIFSKWYREMDTICSPAVLFWQEPLRIFYGNRFCLSLMKTLLFTEGSRNWRRGFDIGFVVCWLIRKPIILLFFRLSEIHAFESVALTTEGNSCWGKIACLTGLYQNVPKITTSKTCVI